MTLTKLISEHGDVAVYVNLDHIVSVFIHPDNDYHVEMVDGSSMHISLSDPIITALIAAAIA